MAKRVNDRHESSARMIGEATDSSKTSISKKPAGKKHFSSTISPVGEKQKLVEKLIAEMDVASEIKVSDLRSKIDSGNYDISTEDLATVLDRLLKESDPTD